MPYSSLSLGERVKPFTPEKAKEIIMSLQQPAVFCNMVFDWPAQHWTAKHLSEVLQAKQIRFRMGLRSTDTGSERSPWQPPPQHPTLSAVLTPSLGSRSFRSNLSSSSATHCTDRKTWENSLTSYRFFLLFKHLGLNTHTKCKSVYSCIPHVARHYCGWLSRVDNKYVNGLLCPIPLKK